MSSSNSSTARRVVITGVTRGLGRALTNGFVSLGWRVAGCGRAAAEIDALRSESPTPHRFDVVDITRNDEVSAWASDVAEQFGPPDLLINNAAIINANAPLWEVSESEFARVMDINVTGTFRVAKTFLPAMLRRGQGVIANLSSGWGRSVAPEVAPYCASKWAIEGLTQALAMELPDGIAAVAVNPGIINTDMLRSCWANGAAQFPDPVRWSRQAVPFFAGLTAADNGRSLTVPGVPA